MEESNYLCGRIPANELMTKLFRHLAQPDWWTAIFSGVLAVTALGALWYARDQIREARAISETQLAQARHDAQIQHLLELVKAFDEAPMTTYRRDLGKKRLKGKPDDPFEMYRELDFFETVDLLVDRGYLNEQDVWNQFRWWVFNLNADEAVQEGLAYENKRDANAYAGFISLVIRLQRIDEEEHGTDSHPTPQDVTDFYSEESRLASGGK
jgi:hypothetical protein